MSLQMTSDHTFDADVATGLVLVDVGAEWCAPCRVVHPILAGIADEYGSRISILSLDADHNPRTVTRFAARSLPTVLFFRDGALVDRMVGALPGRAYLEKIEAHLHDDASV